MQYLGLLFVVVVLIVLLTPVTRYTPEAFVGDIEPIPEGLLLGGQGEMAEIHTTDIHSRIPFVRLTDPTSRWSQSY